MYLQSTVLQHLERQAPIRVGLERTKSLLEMNDHAKRFVLWRKLVASSSVVKSSLGKLEGRLVKRLASDIMGLVRERNRPAIQLLLLPSSVGRSVPIAEKPDGESHLVRDPLAYCEQSEPHF